MCQKPVHRSENQARNLQIYRVFLSNELSTRVNPQPFKPASVEIGREGRFGRFVYPDFALIFVFCPSVLWQIKSFILQNIFIFSRSVIIDRTQEPIAKRGRKEAFCLHSRSSHNRGQCCTRSSARESYPVCPQFPSRPSA